MYRLVIIVLWLLAVWLIKVFPLEKSGGGIPARYIMKTEDYAKKCYENRLPYDPEKIKTDKKNEMLRVLNMEERM